MTSKLPDAATATKEPTIDGKKAPFISVLVPVFNERESIAELHEELSRVLRDWGRPYELVFVNDGSTDGSDQELDHLASHDPTMAVVHFRRNFGQTAAFAAAIDQSTGEILVPMDSDLQNNPADIPALAARLEEGYDVVSGWRRDRQDDRLRSWLSRLANRLVSYVTGVHLHDYGCSLKAYRREVIDGVRLYGEMHRFLPLLAAMQGGRVMEIVADHRPRHHGRSHYGLARVIKVPLDLLLVRFMISYSSKPMYVFGGFGFACLLLSLVPITLSIGFKLAPESTGWHKDLVETPFPVMAAVALLAGFLSLLHGLLADLLMRTYYESQSKRTYVIRRVVCGRRTAPSSLEN